MFFKEKLNLCENDIHTNNTNINQKGPENFNMLRQQQK